MGDLNFDIFAANMGYKHEKIRVTFSFNIFAESTNSNSNKLISIFCFSKFTGKIYMYSPKYFWCNRYRAQRSNSGSIKHIVFVGAYNTLFCFFTDIAFSTIPIISQWSNKNFLCFIFAVQIACFISSNYMSIIWY